MVNGRAGTGMQGYGKQLTLKELAAVVTYERNAWGNNTGDAIQAADVGAIVGTAPVGEVEAVVAEVKEQVADTIEELSPTEDLNKTYSLDEMMVMGEEVYVSSCAACHQASGEGMAPVFPALKKPAQLPLAMLILTLIWC